METTAILASIIKYGWLWTSGILLALFTWLFRKTNDTYSKSETIELIDLKQAPLKQSIDSLKESTDKSVEVMEKLCNSLGALHIDVAVIKNQVQNMDKRNAK